MLTGSGFYRAAHGIDPANGVRVHVAGIDLVRDVDGNRDVPGARHIVVGHGRDYGDVLPHKGIYHGAPGRDLKVTVRFNRLA
ncbi:hypothetical protein ABH926_002626 [Catenulispora sp. GP43]